jgi:CubicO group peptidase (beta-lactamase class C family)
MKSWLIILWFVALLNVQDTPLFAHAADPIARQLAFDKAVSQEIAYQQSHAFQLKVSKQGHIDLLLEQRGINVGVSVYHPSGHMMVVADRYRFLYGKENVSFEVIDTGLYQVIVTPHPGIQIETELDANAFIWDGERRVPYEWQNTSGEYVIRASFSQKAGDVWERIDQLFRPYQWNGTPGVAVGIMQNGEMTFARGYGMANVEYQVPISPHTPFHIASVSKQFAAYALAVLHVEGKISLDHTIQQYIPEMQIPQPITLRQMLHHTSGLRDQWIVAALAGWRMDDVITQEQLLKLTYAQKNLNFLPGSQYYYSNTNYLLAAEVLKRVTGQTLRQWTTEHVFAPLGMRHTFFYDDHEEIVPGRTYSYDDRSGVLKKSVLNFANIGATSLFTTVHDFVKWMANFNHPTVGNADVLSLLTTPGILTDGSSIHYALGVGVGQYKGKKIIDHSGVDAGYRSFMLYFPGEDLGIIILSNVASCQPADLAQSVADILLDLPPHVPQVPLSAGGEVRPYAQASSAIASKNHWKAYEGTYYNDEIKTAYQLFEKDGKLWLAHKFMMCNYCHLLHTILKGLIGFLMR